MQLKTMLNVRKAEFLSYIVATIINRYGVKFGMDIDPNNVVIACMSIPYLLDFYTSSKTERLTEEYLEIKTNYDEVIRRTDNLMQQFELYDPIEVFAMYVYMYRKGYLSYNKKFTYDSSMKDFARMNGVDVVRGTGVCRSISGFLTDLYKSSGYYSAQNLVVRTNKEAVKSLTNLSSISIESSVKGSRFSSTVSSLTSLFCLPNHQITLVSNGIHSYVLDPTNDGMLLTKGVKKLIPGEDKKGHMNVSLVLSLCEALYGECNSVNDYLCSLRNLYIPQIDESEYRRVYLETLKLCRENEDVLEMFYNDNKDIYADIVEKSNVLPDFIQRKMPLISTFK